MDPEETIEVVSSDEGGNGLPPETPSEPTETETPAAPLETEQPTEPVVELFELPDGRKVTGEELYKEHTENLLPEFTRRSQELASLKNGTLPTKDTTSPLADPDWQPESYADLINVAKLEIKADMIREQEEQAQERKALEDTVASQLATVKASDPTVNENALFLHATKYGFRDLTLAHQNMKDMAQTAKTVQKTTATNIAKRSDPVSFTPGATGSRPDPSNFENARDYLRSIKQ